MAFEHVSVLLHETVDGLNVKPDGIYVDATLGGGGHAYEVCTKLGEQGRLIGIDLSLIHISEPTRRTPISYAVFCLKKKNCTKLFFRYRHISNNMQTNMCIQPLIL